MGFGGKDSACFGSRDWPETPSFFRCVSVPEYCSCTRKNIRIKIRIKYNIKLLKGTQYIYVSCVAVMMNIKIFKVFTFLHSHLQKWSSRKSSNKKYGEYDLDNNEFRIKHETLPQYYFVIFVSNTMNIGLPRLVLRYIGSM